MTSISAQGRFIVRDNIKLHHLDWGNHGAHPIVLVHGSRLHAHVWNHFGRRFAEHYHIIALDQRGHGDSEWSTPDAYQMENFYEDLHAVVEARGLSRFTLIGHSLGGQGFDAVCASPPGPGGAARAGRYHPGAPGGCRCGRESLMTTELRRGSSIPPRLHLRISSA